MTPERVREIRAKPFPVNPWPRSALVSIPWSVAERAYVSYVARYGKSQTIERLAERGGFSEGELDALAPGWRAQVP